MYSKTASAIHHLGNLLGKAKILLHVAPIQAVEKKKVKRTMIEMSLIFIWTCL